MSPTYQLMLCNITILSANWCYITMLPTCQSSCVAPSINNKLPAGSAIFTYSLYTYSPSSFCAIKYLLVIYRQCQWLLLTDRLREKTLMGNTSSNLLFLVRLFPNPIFVMKIQNQLGVRFHSIKGFVGKLLPWKEDKKCYLITKCVMCNAYTKKHF